MDGAYKSISEVHAFKKKNEQTIQTNLYGMIVLLTIKLKIRGLDKQMGYCPTKIIKKSDEEINLLRGANQYPPHNYFLNTKKLVFHRNQKSSSVEMILHKLKLHPD